MERITTIDNGTKVYDASIIRLDASTSDAGPDGYLRNNGTNRSICAGICTKGYLQMWIETNGNPVLLSGDAYDAEDMANDCRAMADEGTDEDDAVSEGAQRIVDACDELAAILKSDAALDDIDRIRSTYAALVTA